MYYRVRIFRQTDRQKRPSVRDEWERFFCGGNEADKQQNQKETLDSLRVSLQLRPDQMPLVENELSLTAQAITKSHDTTVLEYHQHLLRLYEKLIRSLDKQQAEKLKGEKKVLENKIRTMLSEGS